MDPDMVIGRLTTHSDFEVVREQAEAWLSQIVSLRNYLRNAYRVLLTRSTQGMVLFVPPGDETDATRPPNPNENFCTESTRRFSE